MTEQGGNKEPIGTERPSTDARRRTSPSRKKLTAHFVDEVTSISVAPNGACRLYFSTWSTDDSGAPLRVDAEVIMTRQSLETLAEALPKALLQAAEGGPHAHDGSADAGDRSA